MKCSRDGICNVVYAMHRFLKICVFIMCLSQNYYTRLAFEVYIVKFYYYYS